MSTQTHLFVHARAPRTPLDRRFRKLKTTRTTVVNIVFAFLQSRHTLDMLPNHRFKRSLSGAIEYVPCSPMTTLVVLPQHVLSRS